MLNYSDLLLIVIKCTIKWDHLWLLSFFRFSEVRFVDGDSLLASGLPVTPAEFESLVKQQCAKTREFLKRT